MIDVRAHHLLIFDSSRPCGGKELLSSEQSLEFAVTSEAALQDLDLSDLEDPCHRRRSNALLFLYTNVSREDAATRKKLAACPRPKSWVRPTAVAEDAAYWGPGDGRAIRG